LENTAQLKGALKKKIEENREQILFSKFLATIKIDVPVNITADDLALGEKDVDTIKILFEDLEFRTLLTRVLKIKPEPITKPGQPIQGDLFAEVESNEEQQIELELPADYTSIATNPHTYSMLNEEKEMVALNKALLAQKSVCFDTETTGMDPLQSEMVGLSFAFKENEAYYVPISADQDDAQRQIEIFRPFFENESIEKVGQNIKYDILVLRKYQIEVKGPLFDTMIAHYLLNPEIRHGMDYMAETYLKYQTIHIEELIGPRGKNQKSMRNIDPAIVSDTRGRMLISR